MKDIFLSITILLGMQILHAQSLPLKVDGGGDVHRCSYEESVQLGGKPTVSGGVAPYTYQWSMIPKEEYYYGLITASKLLTDTTIANPTFKEGNDSPDPIHFF